MLTVTSTLRDIERANQIDGLSTKKIANELGVGEKKLRDVLKAVGFTYDAKLKQWRQEEGSDGSLLDSSFAAIVSNLRNTGNTDSANSEVNTENTGNTDSANSEVNNENTGNKDSANSEGNTENTGNTNGEESGNTWNMGNIEFTNDELLVLKEMIAKHTSAATVTNESEDILKALEDAPKGDTTKRTFSLNNNVIGELDEFCDKHRISKSDFVAMAIQDALKKFK